MLGLKKPIQTPKAMGQRNPRNWPFSFGHLDPHIIHKCLSQPYLPPKMAIGSNQRFCNNRVSGQTNRPTDRWSKRETCIKSAYTRERYNNNKSSPLDNGIAHFACHKLCSTIADESNHSAMGTLHPHTVPRVLYVTLCRPILSLIHISEPTRPY